jgi:CRISPR-associated endonuclease Cas2
MSANVYSGQKQHATKEIILELLRTGEQLFVEMVNDRRVFRIGLLRYYESPWEQYYPSSVERHLTRLLRRGMVDIKETTQGTQVIISDRGSTEVLRYDIDNMQIPAPRIWDGMWRMVIFDIPGKEERIRAAFRNHLKSMGFYQMQKSVYVHPYPCEKQIQYLREVYNIPHSVKLATMYSLENDEDLRKVFNL